MKDWFPLIAFVIIGLLGYDDFQQRRTIDRLREEVRVEREHVKELMDASQRPGAHPPGQPPRAPAGSNWFDRRLQEPSALDAPPTQSQGGGGRPRGGGGGPGGGGPGGRR